jgi:hypothetical protein
VTSRETTPLPPKDSDHNDRCESEFITGPMAWAPCRCAERAGRETTCPTCHHHPDEHGVIGLGMYHCEVLRRAASGPCIGFAL